ncbi:response regulator receiver protein [Desulfarculus baarsii DSM 2075]|uniref:Response regulator receiver protein n=1 Tax=Desulfarculus baarsii (strain ATCC 33931 / DSM 2075 / LMG 7858 / VKM B-1802 / 2st14) TaxID=644282 RepID=E1QHS4_DESB2|nr:response regulator [Desulfarculus baarsii]ADK85117.1 response regulator receiver protein [Desulfarculus baarsii DSM 2075]
MAKILIIDDDPDFTLATKAILTAAGHQVVAAPSGKVGLDMVKDEEPDLIILDIMMDSIFEGFSVTTTLRGTPEYMDYRQIPVLMCSGVKKMTGERFHMPKEADLAKGDDYLDKPFTAEQLLGKVNKLLGK